MKIHRYILDDRGVVLIVDREPVPEQRQEWQHRFNQWAQMMSGRDFPLVILPGDENTKVDDLRRVDA